MTADSTALDLTHSHVFLGDEHDTNKKRTWWVIGLCGAMMVAEIVGGLMFGSIALVADGLHMSSFTKAAAKLGVTQSAVILFFWPTRASSANQTSMALGSTPFSRPIASRRAEKLF